MTDDQTSYRLNQMEQQAKAMAAELLPLRDTATDKRERKELSRRLKLARGIAKWARTRAGYERP
jgi:hypothetical protein